ncbi:hypothetical protein Ancab_009556 [Ancistrocladus abbreviatus]
MWFELLCGLVLYKLLRLFFSDDDVLNVETSNSDAIFSVASRIEKLYGGKVFVGLRIPDADTASPQNIDIVLVTKGEVVVISVKNLAGFVTVSSDGSWVCMSDHKHMEERHLDPVEDAKRQALILEAYLEQRGVALPEGYMSCKIIIPNPKFRTLNSDHFPPEVIPYEQWVQLKPDSRSMLSGWIKGAFRTGKKDMQESIHQQLNFILSTAPMWDRLELKGNRYLLGEFLEFKGKNEDTQALLYIKRSKVGQMIVQKTSMFGLAPKNLQVLYCLRDYRTEGASSSEWKEMTVRSSTEVLFQPMDSRKLRKIKLSSVSSMTLSA